MKLADIQINSLEGNPINWPDYLGKKILFVNVASECGFTPQYAEMQGLYEEFKDKNFVLIGVPSNDFGGQEPGTAEQIGEFCTKRYGVTFPLTEKITVLGENKHPLYRFLTAVNGQEVEWNFQKFAVNEAGEVVATFSPGTTPFSDEIVNWIEK
jgi:glutathione peroxidase